MIVKTTDKEIYDIVMAGVISIERTQPIFSYLLISLPISIDSSPTDKRDASVYTDGLGIKIEGNTEKLKTLFNRQVDKVLEHELEHVLLEHLKRLKNMYESYPDIDKQALHLFSNMAQDYIINTDLNIAEDPLVCANSFEPFGITKNDLEGLSSEEIVLKMIKMYKEKETEVKGMLKKEGFYNPANHTRGDIPDFDDIRKKIKKDFGNKDKFFSEVIKSGMARNYGNASGTVWKELEDFYGGNVISWEEILRNEVRTHNQNEIGENGNLTVNRRYYQFVSQGMEMPIIYRRTKKDFKDCMIAIDTSGSISDETYKKEITATLNLLEQEGGEWKVVLFDADIKDFKNKKPYLLLNKETEKEVFSILKKRTYGGTDIQPVLDVAKGEKVKLLILVSDMEFNYDVDLSGCGFRRVFIATEPVYKLNKENIMKIAHVLGSFKT